MEEHAEGSLDVPDLVRWPNFPFGGDLHVNALAAPLAEEWVRPGDPDGPACHCQGGNPVAPPIWSNDRWHVGPILFGKSAPPYPAYMLSTVDHLDVEDLDETMAAEMGTMSLRLVRAITSLDSVGRTHFNRWGDLGAHLHIWFLGRPVGAAQLAGFTLPMWGFTLPAMSDEEFEANNAHVIGQLTA